MTLWNALELGITDIWTFNCGRRPRVSEQDIAAMIISRFSWIN
jgi:hypothetical protein